MQLIELFVPRLGFVDITLVGLPVTAALAAVALIGYIFGQRTRKSIESALDSRRQNELNRAAGVARKLETIADGLRQDLAAHHSRIDAFKRRLREAQAKCNEHAWTSLCAEAEAMLAPTLEFAHRLSYAYDQIRQQSGALETFAHGRTDPLTGVGTQRALDQQLQVLFAARVKSDTEFVVAILGLDRNSFAAAAPAHPSTLTLLPRLAGIIRSCMRESDFVARVGEDEFVVVMPQTSLSGAGVFGDRLRKRVAQELSTTVSCGLAEAREVDDAKSLLGRADSALYSAKAAGRNRLFVHTGTVIREQHGFAAATAMSDESRSASAAAVVDVQTIRALEPDVFVDGDPSEPATSGEKQLVAISSE
jgi:diguanylate cyclase